MLYEVITTQYFIQVGALNKLALGALLQFAGFSVVEIGDGKIFAGQMR